MIDFDNSQVFGRSSYYVNEMMSENRPGFMLKTKAIDFSKTLFCTSGYDKDTKEIIIKVVNTGSVPNKALFILTGIRFVSRQPATIITLRHAYPKGENSVFNPTVIVPNNSSLSLSENRLEGDLPPYSLSIIRIKAISKAE
jgi:alpha-N-arabinofuranosidase